MSFIKRKSLIWNCQYSNEFFLVSCEYSGRVNIWNISTASRDLDLDNDGRIDIKTDAGFKITKPDGSSRVY